MKNKKLMPLLLIGGGFVLGYFIRNAKCNKDLAEIMNNPSILLNNQKPIGTINPTRI